MDPTDPTHLFVGVNTGPFFDPPLTEQGYYYSTNGGRNWNGSSILPGITGDYASDPAVAFNADGIAFFNYIETTPVFKAKVQKSIDGGFTWGSQIVTIPTAYSDKNHMAVDITNSNFKDNIYVAFSDQINKIRFSRSTDGGSIFSTAENIDGSFPGTSRGVNLVVGTNGEVYAVWALGPGVDEGDSGQSSIINDWAEEGAETNLIFNMSANGGSNWSGAADIFNIQGIKGFWYHKNNDLVAIRVNSFPSVAVDHSGGIWDGTIYLVWTDESLYGDPDIVLSKSADGGTTWSNPVRVNDDPSGNGLDQWFPWVSVNPYGLINIVFYDSRNDPNNRYTEVWVAQSADGGESFTNFRVSDWAFMPCPIQDLAPGYMGDYIGIVSTAGAAYACWMDPRIQPPQSESEFTYQVFVDSVDTYQPDLLALAHSNKSLEANATYSNSARHLAETGNYLHEVFASGGEIFYRRSSDGGNSWDVTERISSGNRENKNACLSYYGDEESGTLHVLWERKIGEYQYEVWYSKSDAIEIDWTEPVILPDAVVNISSYQNGAMPVISYNQEVAQLVAVFCSEEGLHYRISWDYGDS